VFNEKSNPLIINNIISNNQAFGGGGIACYLCDPVVINNTITGNGLCDHGGGLDLIDSSPVLINTIIYGNQASTGQQVHVATFNGPTSEPGFLYCDIEGGRASFARDHSPGGKFNGRYENIIESDPLFIDASRNDYHLADSSPCIGRGTGKIIVKGNKIVAPLKDPDGNYRPSPADSGPDIGAFENLLGNINEDEN
jgi:hypothetical protein